MYCELANDAPAGLQAILKLVVFADKFAIEIVEITVLFDAGTV